ncbi:MAG: HlyD family secretion protein [Waddliaceae bacterium]
MKTKKTFYRSALKLSVAAFILFAIAAAAVFYFMKTRDYVWTNDAFIEGYGTDLSANVTERILGLYCEEGDVVKKGDLIAQLQNNVPLAQKKEAEAQIESLAKEIRVKKAYYKKIRNDYIRALEGIEDKVISAQDFDHSEKDFKMAEAELELAYANSELAKEQLDVIKARLTHYTIHAPQDGVIAKRWVWVGDVTTPGQSLFTMYDLENVWVTAFLEETKIENVALGGSVEIKIDAYPGYIFRGNVFTIKGAAASQFSLVPQNNATGNFTKVAQRIPIKISLSLPEDFPKDKPLYLFPGMSAEVWIKVKP